MDIFIYKNNISVITIIFKDFNLYQLRINNFVTYIQGSKTYIDNNRELIE